MIAPALRRCVAPVLTVLTACAFAFDSAPLRAADASAWIGDDRSALRLIAGTPPTRETFLRAGVEIKLAPGWKTYWRYPGDSGVAPRFDFTRSTNLESVEIDWPAPQAWHDESGTAIGYKESVILPLRVTAKNPARPVSLSLAFDYAICERVCVPKSGTADLQISTAVPAQNAALVASEARVPKRSRLGAGTNVAIRSVERRGDWPRPMIVVEVLAPPDKPVDLFVEGPRPDWALPVPQATDEKDDGMRRVAVVLEGIPSGVDAKGVALTLTAVAGATAIEVPVRID